MKNDFEEEKVIVAGDTEPSSDNQNLQQKQDRTVSIKHIQILDARNIQVGKTNGTMIATEALQKLGFFGKTPAVQPSAISHATGSGDVVAAVNAVIDALVILGIIA